MTRESWLVRMTALLMVLAVVQLGLLAFQARQMHDLREEVDDLRSQGAGRRAGPGGRDPLEAAVESAVRRGLEEQARSAQALQKTLDRIGDRTSELETAADKIHARLGDPSAVSSAGASSTPTDAELAALIDAAVQKRIQEGKGWEMGVKPSMAELKKNLELSAQQEALLRELFDAGKKRAYELGLLARPDGTNKLDDFVAAAKSPNPPAAMTKILNDLATEKVPGQTTTYLEEFARLGEEVKLDVRRQLSSEQYAKFDSMNVDVFGVGTGYDPFAAYILDRIAK